MALSHCAASVRPWEEATKKACGGEGKYQLDRAGAEAQPIGAHDDRGGDQGFLADKRIGGLAPETV